jgi:hypothetical protein
MSDDDDQFDAGTAMTEQLMNAIAPIVQDQPTGLVIEACAAAMMATLTAAQLDDRDVRTVLSRYAERILDFAGID